MKRTHIIGIIVIAIAIGAIMSTVSDSSTYASFAEAIDNPGKEYHVSGRLNKEAPMTYDPLVDVNMFTFFMVDTMGWEEKVHYRGTKPQDFDFSEKVVLVGKYNGEFFEASKILLKCPSKYEDGQPGEMKEFTAEG